MSKTVDVMWGKGCTQTFWTVDEAAAEIAYLNGLIEKRKAGRGGRSAAAHSEMTAWASKRDAIEKELKRVAR